MLIPNALLNLISLRNLNQVTTVYIHHSVADPTFDVTQIAEMEKLSQGFVTVGYNYYVKCLNRENDIWVGQVARPLNRIPAAQYGDNLHGYAICIAGNYEPNGAPFLTTVSDKALHVTAAQILLVKAKCPNLKWLQGHRDVKAEEMRLNTWLTDAYASAQYGTACPGNDLYRELPKLRQMTGLGNVLN